MCYIVKPKSSARGAAAACIKDDLARQEGEEKKMMKSTLNPEVDLQQLNGSSDT
jgi:hypothetical protein